MAVLFLKIDIEVKMSEYSEIIGIIGASGTLFSAVALLITVYVTYRIHNNQKLLSQRQLILPLWEYISNIKDINYEKPVTPDVIRTVNTLELIALLCEGGIIDEQIIRRTFKEQYIKHYDNIKKCGKLEGCVLDGDGLLRQNKAAMNFYRKLSEEFMQSDRIVNHK